jgi:hypothetical protein
MLWLLAWSIIGWVIVADIMYQRSRYLDSVADALEAASKNDITKLAALGFVTKELSKVVKIELHDKRSGANSTRYFELPISPAKMFPLAIALLNGKPFSEKHWTGPDGLFSTNEFRTLRGVMRDHGLIQPISQADNRQGFKLTEAGQELFETVLSSPPPLPDAV